jgi:hypothetical protein
VAELRNPANNHERLLWRKLTLRIEISEVIVDPNQTATSIRGTDFVRLNALVWNTFYLFDASNNNFLLIGIYFDAELISEVDVNLGTP